MKTKLVLLFILIQSPFVNSQTLSDKLWAFASNCHNAILSGYEEMDIPSDKFMENCKSCIDDAKNGYLFIEGAWPTCGCSCHAEIGAYKKSDGSFVLVKYEKWPCDYNFGIYSSENLETIFPQNFNLNHFANTSSMDSTDFIFLEIEIPKIGTETKAKLKLFPLGQVGFSSRGISYNTERSKILYTNLYSLKNLAQNINNESYINHLLKGNLEYLPETVKKVVLNSIGRHKEFDSINDLVQKLSYAYKVYNIYTALNYTEITFIWNRDKGQFEIKKLSGEPAKISFLEFLKTVNYFSHLC